MIAKDRLVVANRCYAELYGLDPGVIKPGMHAREIFALRIAAGAYCGETPEEYYALLDGPRVSERTDKLRNGRHILVRDRETGDGAWATIQEDVTESFRAAEELAYAARHDALTGLANRAVFKSHLVERLESARHQPFAAMVIDIDGFKEVNDTYGHEVGDGVLGEVARRFEQAHGVALLARLGGDEFALVTTPCASADEVEGMAGRVLETGRRPIELDGRFISLDLSLGVYVVGPDERDASQIMRRLDLALSAAKAGGHNGYKLFEDELERGYVDRYQIARDLKGAIAADQLEVHYQPIFDRRGKRIICMEALARWRHPQRGPVPPATFIPIAEAAGLIGEIGEWVLRRAAADAASWRADITVAVNVSALQAERPDFVDAVLAVLEETSLPAHRLQLEITELILLRADATIEAMLARLRAKGVTFALDDFGTGYASLAYLKMFPIDKIKVDQSFVKDVCKDAHSIAIVSAIVALARGFDAPTTAEGVETAEQFETLRALGVDAMQGYYFSRPKPIREFSPDAIVGEYKISAA